MLEGQAMYVQRNIEARTSNYCSRAKTGNITYSEYVCVCVFVVLCISMESTCVELC